MPAPLQPVIDLLHHVRDGKVMQIAGEPRFSVAVALNILSGLDNRELHIAPISRAQHLKNTLGWKQNPQFSVLRQSDEAALNWAVNEGYFPHPLHVHSAPPLPNTFVQQHNGTLVVHSTANGRVGHIPGVSAAHERLFLLYQQAAVEVFANMPQKLIHSGLDGEQYINSWGLDWLSAHPSYGTAVLRQMFVDAYAAGVLLIGAQGSDEAHSVLTALEGMRDNAPHIWDGVQGFDPRTVPFDAVKYIRHNWAQWSGDLPQIVGQQVGAAFGAWVARQPLATVVVQDMIPNFEQRVVDAALGNTHSQSQAGRAFAAAQEYLDTQWTGQAHASALVGMVQRTATAWGWSDGRLQVFQHAFDLQRDEVLTHVKAQRLGQKLEHYRSKTAPSDPGTPNLN